jgi:glycosyltransferase involved in cell wall biosynthesis
LLLQALHLARQSTPALHLDLIGDGELRADVERTIVDLGLTNHVTLHGAQPHAFVLEAFQRADLFVQHSLTDPETGDEEGLPVAILEAMAAGLPVVSTRHAGIPDAVQHESNGLLVPEGDVTGMAQAITTLALDETKRQAMGQTGHRRALDHFSAQQEITALQKLLGL